MSVLPATRTSLPDPALALVIARWWSRPTERIRESWSAIWPAAGECAHALELDPEIVVQLQATLEGISGEALLDEYERLFVGPGRPPCSPYESLWSVDAPPTEQGMLMGSVTDAVTQIYDELGLRVSDQVGELPDHLVAEWEALACGLDRDAAGAAQALLEDHLCRWMGPFCNAVARETEQPFYAELARLTLAWTAELAR